MSRSVKQWAFPMKVNAEDEYEISALLAHTSIAMPGAIMLALRLADSPADVLTGGNHTVQIGLSLTQIQGLLSVLRRAEHLLQETEAGRAIPK